MQALEQLRTNAVNSIGSCSNKYNKQFFRPSIQVEHLDGIFRVYRSADSEFKRYNCFPYAYAYTYAYR